MFLFVLIVTLAVVLPGAAYAQDPGTVADEIRDDGVYVDAGLPMSEPEVGEYVSIVRSEGEELSIVLLFDEPVGGATTYADAVFNRLGTGVVLVIAAESDGYSGTLEEYGDIEFQEALEVAADRAESDTEFLDIFVAELTGLTTASSGAGSGGQTGSGATPTTVSPAVDDSGGGFGFLFWLLIIGGGILLFMWWRRRKAAAAGPKLVPEMIEAKEKVQEQINAVANDIIDMEDEVRLADNDQADEFYQAAGATYTDVVETFPGANSPENLLELANKLDQAIWQLDSAEAVLDGKPTPPQPVPQRLPTPEPAGGGAVSPGVPSGSSLPPRPDYDRRPNRRSSYGGGGNLMNILIGVAGSMMASRARPGGVRRAPARRVQNPMFPPVPTKSSPIPTPSTPRGGGGRVSTSRTSSSRSRTRRGSVGRSRGGVRRGRRRRR